MFNFNPKQTIATINTQYQKALPKINAYYNTYYEVIKSYARDEKVTFIALSALSCLATVFSFFTLSLSTTTVIAAVTARECYKKWKLFQKSHKNPQETPPKAPTTPIKQEKEVKEVKEEGATPPVSPAPLQKSWLSGLFSESSTNSTKPNGKAV